MPPTTVRQLAVSGLGRVPSSQAYTSPSKRCFSSTNGYRKAAALAFTNYGEPKDVLSLHAHSLPSSPAKDTVTLRFLASPINPADINQIQGVYPSKPTFYSNLDSPSPIAVGGNEGVAEVVDVGSNVSDYKVGDWAIMKAPGFGTWRTHAHTTVDHLMPIKDHDGLTPIQVGTVSINPCTAYRMLTGFVKLDSGDWFIQNGANSGVGRAAIQLGKLWGYKSINIIRRRESDAQNAAMKRELEELGADVVVTDEEALARDFRTKVKDWTCASKGGKQQQQQKPVRLALNCVGGEIVNAMAKTLAENSHVVTYGAMSRKPVTVPASMQIFKNISFDGFWVSRWSAANPVDKAETVRHLLLDLIREGKFRDTPVKEIKWRVEGETEANVLVDAVQGTLEGFRDGKGIFVFE